MLIDDSARLQQTYPGENAEQIETLQVTVIDNWGILQDRAAVRKDQLLAAADLHRYLKEHFGTIKPCHVSHGSAVAQL